LAVPVVFAVLISSLLFAALHSFGSIFSAFIFGVCIAILYLKTDIIFVPIFAHFLNNLFAEIIVVMDPNKILFTNISVVLVMSILAIVSFVIILIFIIGNLKKLNNNDL
jgi:membrane protease YdiL (CAAX protease family)